MPPKQSRSQAPELRIPTVRIRERSRARAGRSISAFGNNVVNASRIPIHLWWATTVLPIGCSFATPI